MNTARVVAPEVDRLVLSVNGVVGPRHGRGLADIAGHLGLESVAPLPTNFVPLLRAGAITDEIATLRMRYMDPAVVTDHLADLVSKGLAERTGDRYRATDRMVPLLDAIDEAQRDVAASAWGHHTELVATASELAARVASAAPADHVVATAHRALPEPDDPSTRLLRRLTLLRFVRQHDHAAAWLGRHLTAAEMPVFTALWHDEPVEGGRPGLSGLAERGYADLDPIRLTARGRRVRDAIEDDTDTLNQQWFDVLGDERSAELVDAVRRLPSAVA